MRKSFMILVVAAVVFALTSFVPQPVEEEVVMVKAEYGSTIWNICEQYYTEKEVRCFDEFVYDVRKENGLLNGKMLQAGQVVKVVLKKQK